MGGHDGRNTGFDGGAKRHQLDRPQTVQGVADQGQLDMRVGRGVPVSRKVLSARGDTFLLQRSDDDLPQARDDLRPVSQRAIADHGIRRVRVHVEDGREVERDSDRAEFARQRAREPAGQAIVTASPERRHGRPLGERPPQPGDAAAFLIDAHPRRKLAREAPDLAGHLCHLPGRLHVSREEDHAAQVELARESGELGGDRRAGAANDGELPDSAVQRKWRHAGILSHPPRGAAAKSHYNDGVDLRASAPTRIDLAGGTIDIWPLYLFHPGAQTLNVAISLRAHVHLASRDDGRVVIRSLDTNRTVDAPDWSALAADSELSLLGQLLHFFQARGLTMTTRCESPAGAGIAGSSALNIAVCGAMNRWQQREYDDETLLGIAMNVEARAIGVPTGVQDYRPALYGGVSAVELGADGVRRVALDVDPAQIEGRIVLAYTGAPRESGTNNWEMTKRHIDGNRQVFDSFERIRDTAVAMRAALAREDWPEVGRQIAVEWENRKRLAPGVTTPFIDELIGRATPRRRAGREGLRGGRRRVSVLLRRAGQPRSGARCARRRRRHDTRLPGRDRGIARWIMHRLPASCPRSAICSRSRARMRSRSAHIGTRPTPSPRPPNALPASTCRSS